MAAEKNFENRVKQFLKSEGSWYVKYFSNAFTRSGIPDVLACHEGYFIGLEIKSDTGKPSPLQIHNLDVIHKAGGFGILLYPKNFELFKSFIENDCDIDSYNKLRKEVNEWRLKLKL